MAETLTQELLGKQTFDALNMLFDDSVKVADNYQAAIPRLADGRIATLSMKGTPDYIVLLRSNQAGGLALASGLFECKKSEVTQSQIDDAMFELIKMVAGQIRNILAPNHQMSEPSALASDDAVSNARIVVGSRLCLGNDETQVDVMVLDPRPVAVTSIAVAQSDDAAVAIVKQAVQSLGMQVVSQGLDGGRALEEIRQLRPDVVCLDFDMANMNGLEVLAAIRQEMPHAIIFLVSASATADKVRSAMKLRPNGIVVRPFDNKRLVADINRALEQRNVRRVT